MDPVAYTEVIYILIVDDTTKGHSHLHELINRLAPGAIIESLCSAVEAVNSSNIVRYCRILFL